MKRHAIVAALAAAVFGGMPLEAQQTALSEAASPRTADQPSPRGSLIKGPNKTTSKTVEVGLFGQYTHYDEDAGIPCGRPRDNVAIVGRVGVFTSRAFETELDAISGTPEVAVVGGDIRYTAIALRLNYNVFGAPLGARSSMLAGLGGVRATYADESRFGVSGIAGVRYALHHRFALRVDGVADYLPDSHNLNMGTRFGLSFLIGRLSRDRDRATAQPAPKPPTERAAPGADKSTKAKGF